MFSFEDSVSRRRCEGFRWNRVLVYHSNLEHRVRGRRRFRAVSDGGEPHARGERRNHDGTHKGEWCFERLKFSVLPIELNVATTAPSGLPISSGRFPAIQRVNWPYRGNRGHCGADFRSYFSRLYRFAPGLKAVCLATIMIGKLL